MNKSHTKKGDRGSRNSSFDGKPAASETFHLQLENGKRYAHTASCNYQISMVSLQPDLRRPPNCACSQINRKRTENDERVTVIVEHDLKEHILCVLDGQKLPQCKLNLCIQAGEQIAFRTTGKIPVLMSGYACETD